MIKRIEGSSWYLCDETQLYENSNCAGRFMRKNIIKVFENEEDLLQALFDTGEVFRDEFGFDDVFNKDIYILNCEETPVSLYPREIGLNRTLSIYEQDMYQFAHELLHLIIGNVVPTKYKWLEESLCMLSSILVMATVSQKYYLTNIKKACEINSFINNNMFFNNTNIDLTEVFKKNMSNNVEYYDHKFNDEKLFAQKLYGFFKIDLRAMHLVKYLPKEECNNGFFYLHEWVNNIPDIEAGKNTLKEFVEMFANKFVMSEVTNDLN